MDWVLLAARLLFAGAFLRSGIGNLLDLGGVSRHAASKGVPLARLAVVGTMVLIVVGGVLVALGAWVDLAGLLLAGFLVATAPVMHRFWQLEDRHARLNELRHLEKDLALAGAALALFVLFNRLGPEIGLTLGDGRLFGRF